MRNLLLICGMLTLLILACQLVEPVSPITAVPTSAPTEKSAATVTSPATAPPITDPLSLLPPGTLPPGGRVVFSTTVDCENDGTIEGLVLYRDGNAYSEGYGLVVDVDSTVHHLGGEKPVELFTEEVEHPAEVAVYDHNNDGQVEILITGLLGPQAAVVNVFRWDGSDYPTMLSLVGEDGVSIEKEGTITARSQASGYVVETTATAAPGGVYRTHASYELLVEPVRCSTPDCTVVAFYDALSTGDVGAAHDLLTDALQAEVAPKELIDRFGATLTAMKIQELEAEVGRVTVSVEKDEGTIQGTWSVKAVANGWRLDRFEQQVAESPGEDPSPSPPPLALVERTRADGAKRNPPLLHFAATDGSTTIVPADGWNPAHEFQVAGDRVYYGSYYASQEGVIPLSTPNVRLPCHPPLVAPGGEQLAWICENLTTASFEDLEKGNDFDIRLVITDGEGNDARVVWQHTETGPLYKAHRVVSWRADGESVYLTRRPVGVAWPAFDYRPGMLEVRLETGDEIAIGDEDAGDAAVSPDGSWLVQAFHGEPDVVHLLSLIDGTERTIPGMEGVEIIGDFSFSPDNSWLVWQEILGLPPGTPFRLRAVRLADGEPFLVHETDGGEQIVGGWLGPDALVVVRHGETAAGSSYLITLPTEGAGQRISPYDFLGVLEP